MSKYIYACLINFAVCDAARILAVFPAPCYSHQSVFRPITQGLAKRGHDVTVITPLPAFPDSKMENLTEINIASALKTIMNVDFAKFVARAVDKLTQQRLSTEVMYRIFEYALDNELRDFLRSGENFDLIILEECARLNLLFGHVFKAPVIQISSYGGSFGTFEMVGAPTHQFLYPLAIHEDHEIVTYLDKIKHVFEWYLITRALAEDEKREDRLVRSFLGGDFPSLKDLRGNVDMVFLNVHPIWDSNRPVPANVIYLGGLHLQETKELPEDLANLLESSPQGSIYMSFGSTMHSTIFNEKKLKIILAAVSMLEYTVFFKWDTQVDVPRNVIARNWFPQADMLKHPNVKLFITQGGLQSMDEAIDAGVPMLGVPVMWDQWYNVKKMVDLQLGVMCDIQTVDEDEFVKAVESVIRNSSYRTNIRKYRQIINDQPQTSLERAIWWTEYVIRHKGGKHLRSPAFDMSATDYYEVELILSVASIFIILFLILVTISYSLLKLFFKVMSMRKQKIQ